MSQFQPLTSGTLRANLVDLDARQIIAAAVEWRDGVIVAIQRGA